MYERAMNVYVSILHLNKPGFSEHAIFNPISLIRGEERCTHTCVYVCIGAGHTHANIVRHAFVCNISRTHAA